MQRTECGSLRRPSLPVLLGKLLFLAWGAGLLPGPVLAQMSTGTYAGDNQDDRNINVGFQPQVVII